MGLGVLNKRILLSCLDRSRIDVFGISTMEGEETRAPKAISSAVKDLVAKGYMVRTDEGGLKFYELTPKGEKKAKSLQKQLDVLITHQSKFK